MEVRSYPITNDHLYAINLKLHVTELLALHYDSKELFTQALIDKIKNITLPEAEKIKERKMETYVAADI